MPSTLIKALQIAAPALGAIAALLGIAVIILRVAYPKWDERLRTWIQESRRGFLRRKYIRVFVGAVRGYARAEDTRNIAKLRLIIPLLITGTGASLLVLAIANKANLDAHRERLDEQIMTLTEFANRATQATQPETSSIDADLAEVKDRIQQMQALVTESKRVVEELRGKNENVFWQSVCLGLIGVGLILFELGFITPFIVFRSQFSQELERFTSRIQGLATKPELAELLKRELAVRDEESARRYVDCMYDIAKRHDVEELCKTFILWERP